MSFQEGRAYKWQQGNYTSGNRTKGLSKSLAERGSNSSINSSVSSSSQSRNRIRQKKSKRPLSGEDSNIHKKRITHNTSSSTLSVSGTLGNYTHIDAQGDNSIRSSNIMGEGCTPSQHMGVHLTQPTGRTITGGRGVGEGERGFFPQDPTWLPKV